MVNSWTSELMESVVIPGLRWSATRSRVSVTNFPARRMASTSVSDFRRIFGFCGWWRCSCRDVAEAQHFLNFLPLPQGHGALRPILVLRFGWFTRLSAFPDVVTLTRDTPPSPIMDNAVVCQFANAASNRGIRMEDEYCLRAGVRGGPYAMLPSLWGITKGVC